MTEGRRQSAASAAAEQVRSIVEAAERSAEALEAAAREDADRIRSEARQEAAQSREAVDRLAERADELERRLDELTAAVREGVDDLRSELGALRSGSTSSSTPAPLDEELIAEVEEVAATEPELKAPEADDTEVKAPESRAPEGARVLALKMALDGSPREETARYLDENFELDDPGLLLDEVYAKAGR